MIELDDCGRELLLAFDYPDGHQTEVVAVMVIKAPKGTMVIFEPLLFHNISRKCNAIKAFMEEHQND